MPITDPQRDELLKVFASAFGSLPCPGKSSFRSRYSHDPTTIERAEKALLGRRWQDYADCPLELVGWTTGYGSNISPLSLGVFQYYLPVFLLAAAFHNGHRQAEDILSELIFLSTPTEEDSRHLKERWSILTLPQIDATIAALKIIDSRYGETSYADDIGPAIEFLKSLRDSAPRS